MIVNMDQGVLGEFWKFNIGEYLVVLFMYCLFAFFVFFYAKTVSIIGFFKL